LRFETDTAVDTGATIKSGDNEVGRVTSSVYSPKLGSVIALAYVRYEHLEPETNVMVNGMKATVTELPFIRGSWYGD